MSIARALVGLMLAACASSPAPREAPRRLHAAPSPHVLRVVPSLNLEMWFPVDTPPTVFLGRDGRGRDVRALDGARYAIADGRIEAAARAFHARITGGARLRDGSWLFMLEDGSLWRARDALAEPTFVARAAVQTFNRFRVSGGQTGALAFQLEGIGYVTSGSWPPRAITALPPGGLHQIVAHGGRLGGSLAGGGRVLSDDGGASFTYGVTGAIAREEPGHRDANPRALRIALLEAIPDLAEVLRVVLPNCGGAWAQGRDVWCARNGRVRRIANVLPSDNCSLFPYASAVVAECWNDDQRSLWLSRDGRSFQRIVAESRLFAPDPHRLIVGYGSCDGRDAAGACLVLPDGSTRTIVATLDRDVFNLRFAAVRSQDGIRVHAMSADGSLGQSLRAFPPSTRILPTSDDSVLAFGEGSVWTPDGGVQRLPNQTTHAAAFDSRNLIAYGGTLRSIHVSEDAGRHWTRLAPDAPHVAIVPYGAECRADRCALVGTMGRPTVIVERAPPPHRVASAVAPVPSARDIVGSIPGVIGQANLTCDARLRCASQPARAPRNIARVSFRENGIAWPGHRSRGTLPEVPHAVADVFLFGDAVVWLDAPQGLLRVQGSTGTVSNLSAAAAEALQAVSRRGGALALGIGYHGARWYAVEQTGSIRRSGEATRNSLFGCFGWVGSESGWRLLVPTVLDETGLAIDLEDTTATPTTVRMPGETPPICGTPPSASTMRIPIHIVGEPDIGLSGTLVLDMSGDRASCIRALEADHAIEGSVWIDPGGLRIEQGQLAGLILSEAGWQRVTCTSQ